MPTVVHGWRGSGPPSPRSMMQAPAGFSTNAVDNRCWLRWRIPPDIPRRIHRRTCQAGAVRQPVSSDDSMMLMPRPFGVSEVGGDEVSLIFAVVGKGTAEFSRIACGRHHSGDGSARQPVQHKGERELCAGRRRSRRAAADARRAGLPNRRSHITAVFGYRNVHFAETDTSARTRTRHTEHRRIRRQCRNAP